MTAPVAPENDEELPPSVGAALARLQHARSELREASAAFMRTVEYAGREKLQKQTPPAPLPQEDTDDIC